MRKFSILLVLPLFLVGACGHQPHRPTAVAIRNVTVVNVVDGSRTAGQTVLVAGNRIVAVGSADAVDLPPEADVIEAAGGYLIPGLWDAHVHSVASVEWHFPLFLAHGVTSVRNMHTSVDAPLEATNSIRGRVASGELPGPRFLANGPIVDGEPPVQRGAVSVPDPERGRAVVDSLAEGGADFIKIYDNLSLETYEAILARAQTRGIPVDGHLPKSVSPARAAGAGQRTIEHTLSLAFACSGISDSLRADYAALVKRWPALEFPDNLIGYFTLERRAFETRDPAICLDVATQLASGGVAVTPTLFIQRLTPAEIVADAPRMAMLPPAVRERWAKRAGGRDYLGEILDGVVDESAAIVRQLHGAGVTLLAGTDVGETFLVPGASLHEELARLVEDGGLSPLAALQAATVNPARVLGLGETLGTIEPGKLADLVLLEADPLTDISNTRRIRAVVADGRVFLRTDLDALVAAAGRHGGGE